MSLITEKIYQESQQLPEHLALQVYDFICVIKARYSEQWYAESYPDVDWNSFFEHYTYKVADAVPLSREAIYAERLR